MLSTAITKHTVISYTQLRCLSANRMPVDAHSLQKQFSVEKKAGVSFSHPSKNCYSSQCSRRPGFTDYTAGSRLEHGQWELAKLARAIS